MLKCVITIVLFLFGVNVAAEQIIVVDEAHNSVSIKKLSYTLSSCDSFKLDWSSYELIKNNKRPKPEVIGLLVNGAAYQINLSGHTSEKLLMLSDLSPKVGSRNISALKKDDDVTVLLGVFDQDAKGIVKLVDVIWAGDIEIKIK